MDKLLKCTEEFEKLLNKDYLFTLSNEVKIQLRFNKKHFHHLLGLHKLTDIHQLNGEKKASIYIYKQIVKGNITYESIQGSSFIAQADTRINNFYDINMLLFNKVVINFDSSKTPAGKSFLKSDIIFTKKQNEGNIHLCLAPDKKQMDNTLYYPETFFYQADDFYTKNQVELDVVDCKVIER